jgi:hypothetical protein
MAKKKKAKTKKKPKAKPAKRKPKKAKAKKKAKPKPKPAKRKPKKAKAKKKPKVKPKAVKKKAKLKERDVTRPKPTRARQALSFKEAETLAGKLVMEELRKHGTFEGYTAGECALGPDVVAHNGIGVVLEVKTFLKDPKAKQYAVLKEKDLPKNTWKRYKPGDRSDEAMKARQRRSEVQRAIPPQVTVFVPRSVDDEGRITLHIDEARVMTAPEVMRAVQRRTVPPSGRLKVSDVVIRQKGKPLRQHISEYTQKLHRTRGRPRASAQHARKTLAKMSKIEII